MSEKEYSYRLSSFLFYMAIVALFPIAGFYLSYFALTRDLDPAIKAIVVAFHLLTFLPPMFIFIKSKQKITILENGIRMKGVWSNRLILWQDVTRTKYDKIATPFSRSRFCPPNDLVIESKRTKIYIMDSIEQYDEILRMLGEKISLPEKS